jgi:hypothetical protein
VCEKSVVFRYLDFIPFRSKSAFAVMDGVPGNLQDKYQKIAAEYAKVCWHVCHGISA